MSRAEKVALQFARSLDREDYEGAAECLAPGCQYSIGEDVHRGPEAILASYRKSGDWAAANLQGIRYESAVRPGEEGDVVVEFTDHLEHGGRKHTHRCEQHLSFDDAMRIIRIRHVDLPGEPEALQRFFQAVGLSRSSSRVFGERIANVTYVSRPSAYGLVRDGRGAFALVRTRKGLFLPGGGIEPGETPAEAVARETREECGLIVRPTREIARAIQLNYDSEEGVFYEKPSAFWLADLTGERTESVESDHELVWLSAEDAAPRMAHESHGWALRIAEEEETK